MKDTSHITLLSSREPEAACHGFSTTLCILVGMPVTSHLIPNLQLLHLNSASICCSFVFLYILEILVNNAGCKYGHVIVHLVCQLLNRYNGHMLNIQNLEYEMCINNFRHINIFCIACIFLSLP